MDMYHSFVNQNILSGSTKHKKNYNKFFHHDYPTTNQKE